MLTLRVLLKILIRFEAKFEIKIKKTSTLTVFAFYGGPRPVTFPPVTFWGSGRAGQYEI